MPAGSSRNAGATTLMDIARSTLKSITRWMARSSNARSALQKPNADA